MYLNTVYGTFVNGYRIQNESVTLKPGDTLLFGKGNVPFSFVTAETKVNEPALKRATEAIDRRQKANKNNNKISSVNHQLNSADQFVVDEDLLIDDMRDTTSDHHHRNSSVDLFATALQELKGDAGMNNEREEW